MKPSLRATRALPVLWLPLAAGCSALDHPAPTTSQRPTFSSDTATTAEGTWEYEVGMAIDPGDLIDTPLALKYGAGESTEVFGAWSPLVMVDPEDDKDTSIGDLVLGFRHRFAEEQEEQPSMAVQGTLKLPTAHDHNGIGSGEIDASVAGILTKSYGKHYAATGYYDLALLGDPDGGTALGHTLAVASTGPSRGQWSSFGEIAALLEPENDVELYISTLGVTYTTDPTWVFDIGVQLGLNSQSPDFQLVFGFTRNLGARQPAAARTRVRR